MRSEFRTCALLTMFVAASLTGACSAAIAPGGPSGTGAAQTPDQSITTATVTASARSARSEGFNPFRDESQTTRPQRVVIEKPTLAEVLQPGPLDEITVGRADAPVTVIKYVSPTCPFCRVWQRKVFPPFKKRYLDTGKVRLVLREFPIGFQSGAATIAIRCARPNRRVALYTALLNQQARWVSQDVRREPIFKIAKRFGVTRSEFDACYQDKALIAGLKAVKDRGRTLGIIGTPNFFVNERREKRVLIMADLEKLIEPLLAGGAVARAAQ
ncbi:MAG: thioredoxin domain-containing protein [Pseudomonadota bacterium]